MGLMLGGLAIFNGFPGVVPQWEEMLKVFTRWTKKQRWVGAQAA
jgi:hypothetical protein